MDYQPYETGKFIVLNEKAKEELKNMSDEQLEIMASYLAYNIRKTQMELMKETMKDENGA
jgi:hypothetical protein